MTPSKVLQALLGVIVALGFFGVFAIIAIRSIPADNMQVFLLMVGALIGSFTTIVGFAFGSSVGSARKDEALFATSKDKT